jgi:predicted ATP-grasp superfamily ATP-dependent carboligase
MQAMMKGPTPAAPPPPAAAAAAHNEVNKLRQLQAKRAELAQQLQAIDSQILKVQGALEVLQSLGLVARA